MTRFRRLFPTLAHMEPFELMLLPVALIFVVAPASVLIHQVYVSMGWIAADGQHYALEVSTL